MSRIDLILPPQAKVTGALHNRDTIRDLDEDMLQIELPGNVFIDVGWYPAWQPNGSYRLVVFLGDPDTRIEPVLRTKDVNRVTDAIRIYVNKYVPASFAPDSDTLPVPIFLNGSTRTPPAIDVCAFSGSYTKTLTVIC